MKYSVLLLEKLNKHSVSLMTDRHCEELAFPVLFPKGRFGYKMDRKEKLTPVRYFNARLLHYSGRFAMNPESLFLHNLSLHKKSFGQHKHCFKKASRAAPNSITIQIKRTMCEKSYLQGPGIFLSERYPRKSTVLAKVYVRSNSNGTTTWNSDMVLDFIVC